MLSIGISLGSLSLLMVQYLSGGAWGLVARRIFEASTRTLPLMVLMFIPIAMNLPTLYKWARPEAVDDPIIHLKAAYLNPEFFYIRTIIYFALWILVAYLLNRWSKRQDAAANDPSPWRGLKKRHLSAAGLLDGVADRDQRGDQHQQRAIQGAISLAHPKPADDDDDHRRAEEGDCHRHDLEGHQDHGQRQHYGRRV